MKCIHQLENLGFENSKCLIVPLHANAACDDNDLLGVKFQVLAKSFRVKTVKTYQRCNDSYLTGMFANFSLK